MWLFLDSVSGRLRAGWRLLAQYATFLVVTALLASLLTISYALLNPAVMSPGGAASPQGVSDLNLLARIASVAGVFVSLLLAARFLDRRPIRDFGFHLGGGWLVDFGFGMLLGAGLMTGIFSLELSLGWLAVSDAFSTVDPNSSFLLAILPPIGIFVCVGIYEEALSRGYQLRNAAEGLNFPALGPRVAIVGAWILSSAFFGLLHAANPNATAISIFNIALAGLMLGAGYVLTGELAIPIGLHISWNFFQGNVYGLPVSGLDTIGATFLATRQSGPKLWTGGPFGPEAGLLGLLAILLGTTLIALYVRLRTGNLTLHTPLAEPPRKTTTADKPASH